MNLTANFTLQELIDPATFQERGPRSVQLLDYRGAPLLQSLKDELSAHYGTEVFLTVNDWARGGQRKLSGFRPPETTTGGRLSQHKFGRGYDAVPWIRKNNAHLPLDCNEVRSVIIQKKEIFMPLGLTTLEDGAFAPTWIHLDLRYTGLSDILIVKP